MRKLSLLILLFITLSSYGNGDTTYIKPISQVRYEILNLPIQTYSFDYLNYTKRKPQRNHGSLWVAGCMIGLCTTINIIGYSTQNEYNFTEFLYKGELKGLNFSCLTTSTIIITYHFTISKKSDYGYKKYKYKHKR